MVDVVSMAGTMYASMSTVVNELNKVTRQKYSIVFRNFLIKDENVRRIRIDVNSGRYTVRLNSELSTLLGFGSIEREFGRGSHLADTASNLPGIEELHNLHVYCDIVENVIVGDVTAPLLCIVEITRDLRRVMMHTIIYTPLFVPIQKKSFDTIQIWIMTNMGQPAPFRDDTGKSGLLNSLI